MTLLRRRWLQLAATATASAAVPTRAGAQVYPDRPIRLVMPLPVGGAADIVAHLIGRRLERLGQPVIVTTSQAPAPMSACRPWSRPRPTATRCS